jgi:hypothetical protein
MKLGITVDSVKVKVYVNIGRDETIVETVDYGSLSLLQRKPRAKPHKSKFSIQK